MRLLLNSYCVISLSFNIVETNLKCDQSNTWEWATFSHGPFLASVALLFSRYFTSMLISGTDRGVGVEIGSGGDIDYLWSSSHMRFFSYGHVSRFRKIEYLVNHEKAELIFKNIHVCSDVRQRGENINCGMCWKCCFTMLIIDACGFKEKATAFDFTGFVENHEGNIANIVGNQDYTFIYDMPLIIEAYEKRGEKKMINLDKKCVNTDEC